MVATFGVRRSGLVLAATVMMPLLAAALMLLLACHSALAEEEDDQIDAERVLLRRGDVGPDEAFFVKLLEERQADCPCDFTMDNFAIGRFDVNGDGQYELLVTYSQSYYCGSRGCTTILFHREAGEWKELTEIDSGIPVHEGDNEGPWIGDQMLVTNERVDGYRTLLGIEHGSRWAADDGRGRPGYVPFCLTLRCLEEQYLICGDHHRPGLRGAPTAAEAPPTWMPSPTDSRIFVRRGDFGGDLAFFESLLRATQRSRYCWDLTLDAFHVGRFDVNDDGEDELFVMIEYPSFCGDLGCVYTVHQKQGGHWTAIARFNGDFSAASSNDAYRYVAASEKRNDGYRDLLGRETAARRVFDERQGDSEYRRICLTERCAETRRYPLERR